MKVQLQQLQSNQIFTCGTLKAAPFLAKFKTEKCKYFVQAQGWCPYGDTCAFAHDPTEIRDKSDVHARYKTKPCSNFTKYAYCKYGQRCLFVHSNDRDRDRTRSNSPDSVHPKKRDAKSRQLGLNILGNYGFEVFETCMARKGSRIVTAKKDSSAVELTQSSEGSAEVSQQIWLENNEWDPNQPQWKKSRLYSL